MEQTKNNTKVAVILTPIKILLITMLISLTVTIMSPEAIKKSCAQESEYDYGDAPDPAYPTLSQNNGASHLIDDITYLGLCVDSEMDGLITPNSDGDDINSGDVEYGECDSGDDEDGVIFNSPMPIGLTSNIEVEASSEGYLNAWIDFNANGDWSDMGDQIFTDEALEPGTHLLALTVPEGTPAGDTYMRFRFSTESGLSYEGDASDGEVEDYKVRFDFPYDFGDAPDPEYPTLFANNGATHEIDGVTYLGSCVDIEPDGQPEVNAQGDDKNPGTFTYGNCQGEKDEDGITFTSPLFIGFASYIEVKASVPGYLSAWADFNADGFWEDFEEQIFADAELEAGINSLAIDIPGNAAEGYTYMRFRFSTDTELTFADYASNGEVEDYKVKLEFPYDYGDAPDPEYPTINTILPEINFAKGAGGSNDDKGYGIATDDAGNIYITGYFTNSATFGEIGNEVTLSGPGEEIFVAKYTNEGILEWAKSAGGSGSDRGYAIDVGGSGNIYVTGFFTDSATFDASTITGTGSEIFVAKYSNTGVLTGLKKAGGAGSDSGNGIVVDTAGNIYITGFFEDTATFDSAIITGTGHEIFITKYFSNGILSWAKSAGGAGSDSGNGITVDTAGNIYLTGYFEDSATFGTVTLQGSNHEIFIAKYASTGTIEWAKSAGGNGSDNGNDVAADSSGNVYMTGDFHISATFGEGENSVDLSGYYGEIFVAKYNNSGTLEWAKSAGAAGYHYGYGITIDFAGNSYITGTFPGLVRFGEGEDEITLTGGGTEIFIAKYTTDGSIEWAKSAGGSGYDQGYAITIDESLNIYLTGYFEGPATFDTITLSGGDTDVFAAKYNPLLVPGPRHKIDGSTYLGSCVDSETDGQPQPEAGGDDNSTGNITFGTCIQSGDDEDGVIISTLYTGLQANVTAQTSSSGNLSAWLDFNADGDWNDDGEKIFSDQLLPSSGTHSLNFTVPTEAALGNTFARFRFSTDAGLSYIGTASDGEIEDYQVTIYELGTIIVEKKTVPEGVSEAFTFTGDAAGSLKDGEQIIVSSLLHGSYTSTEMLIPGFELTGITCDDSNSLGDVQSATATFNLEPGEIIKCIFTNTSVYDYDYGDASDPSYITLDQSRTDLIWAKKAGGSSSSDVGMGIITDESGNSYITGRFEGEATFGEGVNEVTLTGNGQDIFIAKYNSAGTLNWAKSAGGSSNDFASGIAVDGPGNSFVTGYYNISAVFGEGEGNETTLSGTSTEIFIAKYDINGTLVWAKSAGGSSSDTGYEITADDLGNSYVTGRFNTSATFGEGINQITLQGSNDEIFVAKYDVDGNLSWAESYGGSYDDAGRGISLDQTGNAYVTGILGGGSPIGSSQLLIAKYESNGTRLWVKNDGGSNDDYGYSIKVDSSGNIYITGSFVDSTSFGEPGNEVDLAGPYREMFVSKYDTNGNFVWAKSAGGFLLDYGYGITIDAAENVYVTGSFYDSAAFGEGEETINISGTYFEIFVAKYDSNGFLINVTSDGGSGDDYGYGIAADTSGNAHVTGYFYDSAEFGEGSDEIILSGSSFEIFLAKYGQATLQRPRHMLDGYTYMGECVDSEGNGQQSANALGDNVNPGNKVFGTCAQIGNDEDGVTIPPLSQDSVAEVEIKTSSAGNLSAWIDFNADGDWNDSGEQVFVDLPITSPGIYAPNFFVPEGAVIGDTFARFRFSTDTGLSYDGTSTNGEMEDYKVNITPALDFGDAPGPDYSTLDKITPELNFAKVAGGNNDDEGKGITVDPDGNTYVTGYFYGSATFGEGANEVTLSGSNKEIFVAKYKNDGTLEWAKSAGGSGNDVGNSITLDAKNNIYITGFFSGASSFGEGTNEVALSGTNEEIFVAKYSNDGVLEWATGDGGSNNDAGNAIMTDPQGYIYTTGYFYGSANFGGRLWNIYLSGTYKEIFIAKYGPNGRIIWAKKSGGQGQDEGRGIGIDGAGNIYVTGTFYGSADFGTAPNDIVLSGSGYEIFITKYGNAGTLEWAKSAGGNSSDFATSLAVNGKGTSYITGSFAGEAAFGEGTDEVTLSGLSDEIFIAKYSDTGTLDWAKSVQGNGYNPDHGYSITIDGTGNSYVTGSFYQSAIFGEGPYEVMLSGSSNEIFLAKYTNEGTLSWVKSAVGSGSDSAYGIAVDYSGNTYITGKFSGTATFGEGTSQATLTGTLNEIFVAGYGQQTIPGAKHQIDGLTFLGACIDRDAWGQPQPEAEGDDNNTGGKIVGTCSQPGDDEDGVTFGAFNLGANVNIDVITSVEGYLNAWIDFNADGDWQDAGEQVFADQLLGTTGTHSLVIQVPANANIGDTFARFRFSTETGLSYGGPANNGEVEDYMITITAPTLTLSITEDSIPENGGMASAFVQRDTGTAGNLTVNLQSYDTSEAIVPDTVTIPDGNDTVSFFINAMNDSLADGDQTVTIRASSPGFISGTSALDITDDEIPALTLIISETNISENGGTSEAAIIRNTEFNPEPLAVTLSSNDEGEAMVPINIDIPANQILANFTITAQDDPITDGTQTATITATAEGYASGADTIDVDDDEITTINLNSITDFAAEGAQLQYEAIIDTLTTFDVIADYLVSGTGTHPASGADFAGGSAGQAIITAGNISTPINLDVLADGLDEFEEGLIITLSVNAATAGTVVEGRLSAGGTIINLSPSASAGSIPADGETGTSAMQKLSWMPGIDTDNNSQTYNLYLDTAPVPVTPAASGITNNFYQPVLLSYNQTYYWRVDITDYAGNTTTGNIWNFTTQTSAQAQCPGLGIICNPSFEFGTDNWTPNGDTNMITSTDAYDGLGSISSEQLRTSAQNPRWAGFSQDNISGFTAGETYNLQLHAKGTNITQGHVKIKWYDVSAAIITTTYPLTGIEGTIPNWTWYNRVFTVPNGAVTADFIVWHGVTPAVPPQNFAGSTILVDKIIWQPATEYCGTICNENFEAGLLFWTQQGKPGSNTVQTTGAKDGTKFIRSEQLHTSTEPLQWTGIRQTAEVTQGQEYKLRMWFKSENAKGGHVRLTWKDHQGANISTIYPVTGITGTNTAWTKRETILTPPINATKAELIILHGINSIPENFQGSTLWIDNITMICDNLCNGGFENSMDDWAINGYKDVTIDTTSVQEGTSAVLVEQDATNTDNVQWSGISQRLMVSGGNTYNISVWLKKLSAVQGHIKITWRDSDDNFISNNFPATNIEGTDLTWAQYQAQFTAPVNADTAEIFVWHGVQQGIGNMTASRLWVDNVQFNKIL